MTSITTELLSDLRTAIAFLTRLPMPHPDGPTPVNFVRAHRVFPIVGAAIGFAVGICYLALVALDLPRAAAAALALGISALLTGALHEDGLADVADGFGGGHDKASKLEIMRDSRLGTYGALILLVSFAVKLSALAALPETTVLPVLVACHALARGILPVMVRALPNARQDGLAATAGTPTRATAAGAVTSALLIAFLVLPWPAAVVAALAATASACGMAMLAQRQINGQTGDVLGGAEQVAETAILLLMAAALAPHPA
ncbi:adenosylcobinamide-GDP ribazoletransferase [Bradyrhizobium sp. LHD-71]|uniref:adenosylcobinamide-GDP ribazoletransferase n=1 Tax=Bradyrhizobium sp. LHD-71 TaxID=3072141 RepID=UPI00280D4B81|nr:adenosylcobinamide-GDP ribazoletransferase [Bradyrhizobium sp. LHD-71]MDQ8730203.1 adenosylcobinamide-GDP ribazoletransferase [Bradyrhizobium sp. LHD-71]